MISWGHDPTIGLSMHTNEFHITPTVMTYLTYIPVISPDYTSVNMMFRAGWSDGTIVVGHVHPEDSYYCVDEERSMEYTKEARTQVRLATNSILNGMIETDY